MIQRSGVFNVSIMDSQADISLIGRFGYQSGRTVDKFDGFSEVKRSTNECLYLTKGCNGYIHEGEELPPDFICPVCKHGAEAFEKIT